MPLRRARTRTAFLLPAPIPTLLPSSLFFSRSPRLLAPTRRAPLHPPTASTPVPGAPGFSIPAAAAAAAAALLLLPVTAASAAAAAAPPPPRFGANTLSPPDELVLPTVSGPALALSRPRLLGFGGGGAVFAYARPGGPPVAVKFSWPRTVASVRAECAALRALEAARVGGVARCLAAADYEDAAGGAARAVIATEPVVDDAVADVRAVRSTEGRERAVRRVVRTMVEMLAAGVVTSDVQPLVSAVSGDVVFIDLTEAERVGSACEGGACATMGALEVARVASFVGEMLAFVPEELAGVAAAALEEELVGVGGRGGQLADEVYGVLAGQGDIVSPTAAAFIRRKVGAG